MLPTEELVVAEALQQLRSDSSSAGRSSGRSSVSPGAAPWPGSHTQSRFGTVSPPQKSIKSPTGTHGGPIMTQLTGAAMPGLPELSGQVPSGPNSHVTLPPIRSPEHMHQALLPGVDGRAGEVPPPGPPASRWQGILLSATSLLLPTETQNRLRCLVRMLRLAVDHLSERVVALKEAMDQESAGVEPKLSVNAIRQDIVMTISKSTNIISTFASNSLPETTRYAVRTCVLALPSKWSSQMDLVSGNGDASMKEGQNGMDGQTGSHLAESAVLSLAMESLTMIRDVIAIVDETLYRAESWCQLLGKRSRDDSAEDAEQQRAQEQLRKEFAGMNLPGLAPSASPDSVISSGPTPNLPLTPNMGPQSDHNVSIFPTQNAQANV